MWVHLKRLKLIGEFFFFRMVAVSGLKYQIRLVVIAKEYLVYQKTLFRSVIALV